MCERPTLKRSLLLTLILLTIGCVEETAIDYDSKETVEFSEHVKNQVGDYNETLEEVPKEEENESGIVEGVDEATPELNETEDEPTLNITVEETSKTSENQTEKEILRQKYFTWNATFEIYNSSKDRLLPNEIFEIEKDKILPLIPKTEYINYTPIYPSGSNLSSGFSIEVTQDGYNIIQKKIMGKSISEYLSKISLYIIIDPEILVEHPTESELKFCEEDQDCIIVNSGCCPCTAGGEKTSINRKYREYWKDKCKEIMCPLGWGSNHFSCYFPEITCIDNTCKLIPSKKQKEQLCSPERYNNCKNTPEDKWDYGGSLGITCREVIEFCK